MYTLVFYFHLSTSNKTFILQHIPFWHTFEAQRASFTSTYAAMWLTALTHGRSGADSRKPCRRIVGFKSAHGWSIIIILVWLGWCCMVELTHWRITF